MSYSSYDHDNLEPASTMRIERRIYFESGKADLSELVKLPLAELLSLRAESAAAEQEIFDRLKEQAAAWEEQAGRTLFLDKALEYARTLPVTHTANQWEAPDEYRHIRSNMVYQMSYSISENTRYDSAAQTSIPYSWTLRWSLYTNAPRGNPLKKIAGQERKVFASREELDKYLNGRIKAHDHYFTEISPAIPKEYADCFKVNGCLLPGYTIEGEEPAKAAALPTQEEAAQPKQTAATPERREPVNEVFSIFLDNRAEAQTGGPHGYWLSLPTTAEQVQEALKEIHITADNQQDLFIGGFSAPEGKPLELPEDLIKAASVDELNFLAAQLQRLDAVELAELNAAMQSPAKMQTIGQLLDYAENTDCFVLINAKDNRSLGEYYLNDSGLFVVPDPWKPAIDTERLGSFIANEEQGTFTDYGYILRTSDEWQRVHEGQPVPEPYRVMAYPAPELLREESKVQPEAAAPTKAPQPVTPILLNGQNSAERMKEITDRLETGIQELFESERYKAYDYHPEDKSITINEEEAEIVRYIFRRYIEGAGGSVISQELEHLGYKTKRSSTRWAETTVIGIIKNEKYKGDILMGKTFTLDPISKRRLDNFGEEDQFYIRDHHEAIISEEMFEKAQEILKRRAKPRRLGTDGKREKFSRKYAFSCMLECGFCGSTLTRRSWHSGSQYNKVIWQCVTATKKGKKFCPDSKGIAEETIEQAFIESYRLLCQNNKDVLDEFIARTEETLSDGNAGKQLAKVEKDIAALDAKRDKLVDMRLEEIIDKDTYEQKYFDLSSQIEQLQKQREDLQESAETESTMKKRIAEFRKTLEENEVLDTFDRYVFESIVEKVIVGGYDEDGNKDPSMLTFIYKTGFKNSLDGTNFKPPRKNSKTAKQNAGLCSHTTDEAKSMYSYHSNTTC